MALTAKEQAPSSATLLDKHQKANSMLLPAQAVLVGELFASDGYNHLCGCLSPSVFGIIQLECSGKVRPKVEIEKIVSLRLFKAVYWQIVHEWEDAIAEGLGIDVCLNDVMMSRWVRGVWGRLSGGRRMRIPPTFKKALSFIMRPGEWDCNICGKRNIIPAIIDFWLSTDAEFRAFEDAYCGNPAVLMTSREAYEIVMARCPRLNVFHWPLSLPDSWLHYDASIEKRWDCAVVGRPNRVLNEWLERYATEHKDFVYVRNIRLPNVACNYVTSEGEELGDVMHDRKSYHRFLCEVKVGLYSTPSMDDSRAEFKGLASNGYNQVTPRFLEYVACRCHVLSRYPRNSDTDYYELDRISPHVETYDEFERRMDYARAHGVDEMQYSTYLAKHVTSRRVEQLREIMERI